VKQSIAICMILLVSLPAMAVGGSQVKYVGGTAANIKAGAVGKLDTTPDCSLVFESAGNKLSIPYASIESFQYTREVARHWGVLPTIVIGLLKVRQHRHFFRITYRDQVGRDQTGRDPAGDQGHVAQVVILEVPKHMSSVLQAVLDARAPQRRQPCHAQRCCCISSE
jgi:hypothetical protein